MMDGAGAQLRSEKRERKEEELSYDTTIARRLGEGSKFWSHLRKQREQRKPRIAALLVGVSWRQLRLGSLIEL